MVSNCKALKENYYIILRYSSLTNLLTRYSYVTYQDIRGITDFNDKTVIAIKAPPETKLEVPDPAEVYLYFIYLYTWVVYDCFRFFLFLFMLYFFLSLFKFG